MSFRTYTNLLALVSRTVATSILLLGLLLMAFGAAVIAFPLVFAALAAAVFFFFGLCLALVAAKVLWSHHRLARGSSTVYRENVRIHTDERSGPFDW